MKIAKNIKFDGKLILFYLIMRKLNNNQKNILDLALFFIKINSNIDLNLKSANFQINN